MSKGSNNIIIQSLFKVAYMVQIRKKKHFVKILTSLVTVLFKMTFTKKPLFSAFLKLYICIYFVFTKKPLFSTFLKLIH